MTGRVSWWARGVRVSICDVFDTVEELASAVTSPLGLGSLGQLTQTLTNALDSVWAEFFGAATPPGGTNWNAYSHQQLYDMLWQDADVGDVSAVAAEWGRHSTALTGFAEALRGQGTELLANWQGRAAELAADRLAELSDRIWSIGARAGQVQKATSDAGEALALARNTMPPPPPDPLTLMTSAIGVGPMSPIEAVIVGGARLFTADAVAGESKAEAVRVMQRYETSLRNSSHRVVPAQPGATKPKAFQVDGSAGSETTTAAGAGGPLGGGGSTGGVPWSRLVGGGSAPGAGGLTGTGPWATSSVLAAESAALSDLAAKRSGTGGFFGPAGMAGRAMEGDEHRRQRKLPSVDNRLFAVDGRVSVPVIGDVTDEEHNSVR
jgi:hypothetical protein